MSRNRMWFAKATAHLPTGQRGQRESVSGMGFFPPNFLKLYPRVICVSWESYDINVYIYNTYNMNTNVFWPGWQGIERITGFCWACLDVLPVSLGIIK